MPEESDISALEKHGQTILASAILLAMTWMGSVVLNTSTDIKVLTEKVAGIEKQMAYAANDRFTRSDADAEIRTMVQRFKAIEYRVERLEGR